MVRSLALVLSLVLLASCGSGVDEILHSGYCESYSDWESSEYVLPFEEGLEIEVTQGNCSPPSHVGKERYSYDFDVDIGTPLVAVRSGMVRAVVEDKADGNGCAGGANIVEVEHSDGTIAVYVHLTFEGSLVEVGDMVNQGEHIAYSGNTGCSSGPHLHFQVMNNAKTTSLPVTFSNTSSNPRGLIRNHSYTAE